MLLGFKIYPYKVLKKKVKKLIPYRLINMSKIVNFYFINV
jgi:hypothetical protein